MALRMVHVSPRISVPLAVIMIFFAFGAFIGIPTDRPGKPVFRNIRVAETDEHFLNARLRALSTQPGVLFLYQFLHAGAAIVWSVAMPLQHIDRLRKRYPFFHRTAGYAVLSCSLLLGLGGLWLARRGLAHTHADLLHLHAVHHPALSWLRWPTFEAALWVLAPAYFYTLFRTAQTARAGQFASHRAWAVAHSIAAYSISINRVNLVLGMVVGGAFAALPKVVQTEVLRLPESMEGIAAAELAMNAGALWGGLLLAAVWFVYEWRAAGFLDNSKVQVHTQVSAIKEE